MSDKPLFVREAPPAYNPYQYSQVLQVPPTAYYSYQAVSPNNNAVIVTTQPTARPVVFQSSFTNDHFLILSVVMTFCCFICGTWCALICTIPAIMFAISAQDAELRGDVTGMARNRRIAAILNLLGLITYMIIMVIFIIAVVTVNVTVASNCYTYNYYYSYSSYC